ncbi:MAG: hypothetical protein Q8N99_07525 [Nanoarchaeota archaeon]|nr:hypothetical protein [Nanoarchaeota archaeon]
MKNSWIMLVLIAFIIAGAIYGINKYKESKDIQKMNKIQFKFINCISKCPILYSNNRSIFKQSCLMSCSETNVVPKELTKKYPDKQLLKDKAYTSCIHMISVNEQDSHIKAQTCLINLISELEKKYTYLKE